MKDHIESSPRQGLLPAGESQRACHAALTTFHERTVRRHSRSPSQGQIRDKEKAPWGQNAEDITKSFSQIRCQRKHTLRQAGVKGAVTERQRQDVPAHERCLSVFLPGAGCAPRAKGPGCQSTPQARYPCSATQAAVAPGPQPQSRTLAPSGSPALRMRSSPYAVSFRPPGRSVSPEASRKAFEPYRGRLIYPPEGPQPRPSCRLPVPQAPESCHILDSGEA